jgi:hypothetical protein
VRHRVESSEALDPSTPQVDYASTDDKYQAMSEEEQVRIEDLRPGDLVMPGLAHAAFDAERVYSVVMYREGALTLCSPEEEGELRIDYQPEEYISRLRDSHQASEQVVPGINLDCPTFHQIRDF